MVWSVDELHLVDFMSHENSLLNFVQQKTLLISGVNLTDEGQNNNGSGKSSLGEALYFALTGNPLREEIVQADLVRNGCAEGSVKLTLRRFSDTLIIIRTVKVKGSSSIIVTLNDQAKKLSSVREYNSFILDLLGIDVNSLLSSYLVVKGRYKPWFSLPDNDKKATIIELARADTIDLAIDAVKSSLSVIEKQLITIDQQKAHLEGQIVGVQNTITQLSEGETTDVRHELERQIEALRVTERSDSKRLQDLHNAAQQLNQQLIDSQVNKPDIADQQRRSQNKLTGLRNEVQAIELSVQVAQKRIATLEVSLAQQLTCPSCNHKFIPNQQLDPTEVESTIADLTQQCEVSQQQITTLRGRIRNGEQFVSELLGRYSAWMRSYEDLQSQLRNTQQSITLIEQTINRRLNEIDRLNNAILSSQTPTGQLQNLQTHLESLHANLQEIVEQRNAIVQNKSHHIKWRDGLMKFRNFVVAHTAQHFAALVNHYLHALKTNLTIEIRGMTELKSGKTSAAISTLVSRNGFDATKFAKFSSGEKIRITVSAILAQHAMSNTLSSGGLDLLFLDEIIESLDDLGTSSLLDALNNIDITIVAITHATSSSVWTGPIKYVVKRNKVSSITDQKQ